MDNQHKKIQGYIDLSQEEIDLMNRCKEIAEEVGDLVQDVIQNLDTDNRWVNIARTDLQKGFMSLIGSIALNQIHFRKENNGKREKSSRFK